MLRFTLIADVKSRYGDVDISVHSPLCPWLLRHAQWLINRYLQKSAGLTAYERRWNRKYHGSMCNFGETLTLRVANVGKTQLSWRDGIWLGRDTESHMHCVAVSSGVFKTRSIRQNIPSRQSSLELLQSITATPWDPIGSKRETDAFILPISKDDPQPLSEGASKEDFVAEEPLDDYVEPGSPLPDDSVEGSEVALPSPPLFSPSRVRRHDEVSPDDGDFKSRPP